MMETLSPANAEGEIKFELDFRSAPPPDAEAVAELNAWRGILYRLEMTGRDPARYGGLAYGNVSQREKGERFIISGTQTGHKERLGIDDYCLVVAFDLKANRIRAQGPIPPSSEALTHAAIYAADAGVTHVIHVHSPEIWQCHGCLGIPATPTEIAYGTPEMARAVQHTVQTDCVPIIAMGGHQDGVIAFGHSAEEAALCLVRHLAKALQFAGSSDFCSAANTTGARIAT